MKTYKIIIDGNEVDLYDNHNIGLAITLAISDSNDLTIRKGSNVKTIKVPATGNNKIIFGHPEDVNSVVLINQETKPKASIEADGTSIFKGFAKINGTTDIASEKVTEYELTFIGDNGDWVSRLNGKYLTDLDYSDQNHIRSKDVIEASETVVAGREYVYDLFDRGKSAYGSQWGTHLKDSVSIMDRFPAISNTSFIDRIFAGIGYKVVSNFKDSAFFKSTYFPFINERLLSAETVKTNMLCDIWNGTNQYISASVYPPAVYPQSVYSTVPVQRVGFGHATTNPGGNFSLSTEKYTATGSGKYKIHWNLYYQIFIPAGSVKINLMKYNPFKTEVPQALDFYEVQAITGSTAIAPIVGYGSITSEKDYDVDFGDEIYIEVDNQAYSSVGYSLFTVMTAGFKVVSVSGDIGVGEYQPVDMNMNLPSNILQLNYIQGLRDCFNLYFTADTDARIVYFEPRDEFYTDEIEDLSALLDRGRDVKTVFTGSSLSKVMRYRYKSDSNDKIISEWEKQNNIPFGSNDAGVENVFATDEVKDITNALFAPTWMDTSDRLGLKTTLIPKLWTDVSFPPFSTKFEPRILVYNGVKALPAGESWKFNKFGNVGWQAAFPNDGIRTTYPSFTFFDETQPNENNLMYGDRVYGHGLFQKHFRQGQKSIDNGRQFIAYINFNDTDISNLDFRKKRYIEESGNGSYFILEKVTDYKSQDGISTLCIFTKIQSQISRKKLQYLIYTDAGQPVQVSKPRSPNPPTSITVDQTGQVKVAGQTVAHVKSGLLLPASSPIIEMEAGLIKDVYYIDENGNYSLVYKG